MRTITIEVPDNLPLAVAASDEDLSLAFRLAVAIFWYDRGLISQGKGARHLRTAPVPSSSTNSAERT